MLETIKKALRISHDKIDDDIQLNIDSAMFDMNRVGIDISDDTNPLVIKCAELYCRWVYNYNERADEWYKAYENLRNAMALCSKYREKSDE